MSQTSTISLALPTTVTPLDSAQPATAPTVSGEAFTAELDRQLQREIQIKQTVIPDATAVMTAEAEKIAEGIGNNLPLMDAEAVIAEVGFELQTPDAAAVQKAETVNAESAEAIPAAEPTEIRVLLPEVASAEDTDEQLAMPAAEAEQPVEKPAVPLPPENKHQIALPVMLTTGQPAKSEFHLFKTESVMTAAPPARAEILQVVSAQIPKSEPNAQQTLKTLVHDAIANMATKADTAVIDSHRQSGATRTAELPLPSLQVPSQQAATSHAARAATPFGFDVQPGLNQPDWSRVVSSRVVFMAREGIQHAELRLNPAQLGPVEVRLSLANEQASVTFLANHAATREALEQALPRLRESFAESGLALGNAEVGQQAQSDYSARDEMRDADNRRLAQVSVEIDDTEEALPVSVSTQSEHGHGVSVYA